MESPRRKIYCSTEDTLPEKPPVLQDLIERMMPAARGPAGIAGKRKRRKGRPTPPVLRTGNIQGG